MKNGNNFLGYKTAQGTGGKVGGAAAEGQIVDGRLSGLREETKETGSSSRISTTGFGSQRNSARLL